MWNVDFSTVNDAPKVLPGEHVAIVETLIKKEGPNYAFLLFGLVVLSGPSKGLSIDHMCTLKPEGLFNLRNTLISCGLNVPRATVRVDPKQIIGRKLGIVVEIREYEGKPYPKVKRTKLAADVGMMTTSFAPPVTQNVPPASNTTVITDDDL